MRLISVIETLSSKLLIALFLIKLIESYECNKEKNIINQTSTGKKMNDDCNILFFPFLCKKAVKITKTTWKHKYYSNEI